MTTTPRVRLLKRLQVVEIRVWEGYEYQILLEDIDTPMDMVRKLYHVSMKTWCTPSIIGRAFSLILAGKEWHIYDPKWTQPLDKPPDTP